MNSISWPGAQHLLQTLYDLNIPLGLVTSATKVDQQRAFENLELTKYFSAIVTVEDVAHPKPDPQPYIACATILGFQAHECIAIEDSIHGISSAFRAGCHVLGLTSTFSHDALKSTEAHGIFQSIPSLEAHIRLLLRAPS